MKNAIRTGGRSSRESGGWPVERNPNVSGAVAGGSERLESGKEEGKNLPIAEPLIPLESEYRESKSDIKF